MAVGRYNSDVTRIPIIREDDGVLLGYIDRAGENWQAETHFGYVFARSDSQAAAEEVVRSQGLAVMQGLWRYYDKKDEQWYPCVIKEMFEHKVIVIRTNDMGYQDPDTAKRVTILNPSETSLVKD